MAINTSEIATRLFKKLLGLGETSSSGKEFYEESYNGPLVSYNNNVWTDVTSIPNNLLVSSNVVDLPIGSFIYPDGNTGNTKNNSVLQVSAWTLTIVPGTNSATEGYAFVNSNAVDIIPFNYSNIFSYDTNKTITYNNGSANLAFGSNGSIFDPQSGILKFYEAMPSNWDGSSPFVVKGVKYIGNKLSNYDLNSFNSIGEFSAFTESFNSFTANTLPNTYFKQSGNTFGVTAILGTNDDQSLNLITSGQSRLFVTNVGNVGIGTTNPLAPLHFDNPNTHARFFLTGVGSQNGIFGIRRYTTGGPLNDNTLFEIGLGVWDGVNYSAGRSTGIRFVTTEDWSGSSMGSSIIMSTRSNGGPSFNQNLLLSHNGRLTLRSNVTNSTGLGSKLGIHGEGSTSSTSALLIQNSNSQPSLFVRDDRRVGIGITSPSAVLHITGISSSDLFLINTLSGNTSLIVNSQGNVGLNTNSPTQILDVNGDIRLRGDLFDSLNTTGLTGNLLSTTPTGIKWVNIGDYGIITNSSFTSFTQSFNSYSAYTLDTINTNYNQFTSFTQSFNSYSAYTLDTINSNYNQFTSFTQSFNSYSAYTLDTINTNYNQFTAFTDSVNSFTANTLPNTYFKQSGNTFGETAIIGTNDNQSLSIVTSGQSRLFVTNVGNVGLNNNTPTSLLDIITPTSLINDNAIKIQNSVSENIFSIQSDGTTNIGNKDTFNSKINLDAYDVNVGSNGYTTLWFYGNTASDLSFNKITGTTLPTTNAEILASRRWIMSRQVAESGGNSGSDFRILSRNDTGGALRTNLTIQRSNGFIGINGLTTPLAMTHIRGAGSTSSTTGLRVDNSNNLASFIVTDDRRVGIGTLSPGAMLHITGVTTSNLLLINTLSGNTGLFINNVGNVGLNTNSPTQILDVNGDVRLRGDLFDSLNTTGLTGNLLSTTPTGIRWVNIGDYGIITNSSFTSFTQSFNSYSAYTLNTINSNYNQFTAFTNSVISFTANTLPNTYFKQSGNTFGTTAIIGTNDRQGLSLETSGIERILISSGGTVGINTTPTTSRLEIYQSGGTVMNISGSKGNLLTVTDTNTGTLLEILNVSGVTIFEVDSNNHVGITGNTRFVGGILDRLNSSGLTNSVLTPTINGVEWRVIDNVISGSTLISGKLNIADFNIYSSTTENIIDNNYSQFTGFTNSFNIYSGYTLDKINSNYNDFSGFTQSFNGYSANTLNLLNTKYDKSGGTITGRAFLLSGITINRNLVVTGVTQTNIIDGNTWLSAIVARGVPASTLLIPSDAPFLRASMRNDTSVDYGFIQSYSSVANGTLPLGFQPLRIEGKYIFFAGGNENGENNVSAYFDNKGSLGINLVNLWVGSSTLPPTLPAKLYISASSATPAVIIDTTGGSNTFVVGTNGVGINNLYPSQSLDVNGGFKLNGSLFDITNSSGNTGNLLSTTPTGVRWVNINDYGLLTNNSFTAFTNSFNSYSAYTLNTINSKLNLSDFNIYSSTTQNIISNNFNQFTSFTNSFNSYSAYTLNTINSKLNLSDFNIYSSTTLNLLNTKYDKTGGLISGNVTISGNLIVNGTATTVNTQNLLVFDPIIGLALSQSGSTNPTLDAGFIIDRGISGNTGLVWVEANKQYELGYTTGSSLNTNIRFYRYGDLKLNALKTNYIYDSLTTTGITNNLLISQPSGVQWRSIDNIITGSTTVNNNYSQFTAFTQSFNSYSAYTLNNINSKVNTIDFNVYSSTTQNIINNNYSQFTAFTNSVNSFTANTLPNTYFKQSGNTFGTTAVLGTNDNQSLSIITSGQSRLFVTNVGNVGIGTTNPQYKLDLSGTTNVMRIIGSASGSTLPIFTIQGSQGELFSVTDNLTGSLFSVNDISGLPIFEVFSNDEILMGNYQAPSLFTTKKVNVSSGSTSIYSFSPTNFDGAFVEYTLKNSFNARSGQMMAVWSGSTVRYTETTSLDIGDTSSVSMYFMMSGMTPVLMTSASTTGWSIKSILKAI